MVKLERRNSSLQIVVFVSLASNFFSKGVAAPSLVRLDFVSASVVLFFRIVGPDLIREGILATAIVLVKLDGTILLYSSFSTSSSRHVIS